MHLIVVGLNNKTAPVEIRERLSFQESQIGDAMEALKGRKSILENVIVSTCNRTEVYAVVDQLHTGKYYIREFLAEWFSMERAEFDPYLFIYENDKMIRHLFNVACGLDSMIIGETQILGQVRSSYLLAQEKQTIGTVFNRLFKEAVTVAKKAHTETDIGANAVSVSYAAVELSKKIFGDLQGKQVAIVGAGKMGKLAIQNLQGSGVDKIAVVNRTFERAKEMADEFNGEAYSLDNLIDVLSQSDIVISSTGSSQYVITKSMMETVEKTRKGKPIFLVDIAVPRDIDPEIHDLDSMFLYDIDDLEGVVEANMEERQKAAELIETFIDEAQADFQEWLNTLGVIPLISNLREKALNIQADVMTSLERKLPDLSERERKVIGKHMKSIINQMLKDPILQIKELAAEPNGNEALYYFEQIFNLSEQKNTRPGKKAEKVERKERKVAPPLQTN
ncbi:glutamyl-tRNA reductase [Pallidibacillus pasinlerensis]|uniref:Glutamyl-tRNA reductase n=1 Tax=Pallidibacillus pasinlerensis TaxID=2703818 RepID=A0ABX0A710_9BACI|nr:glutamyl-tRNA reductase [Pallidibacillus pasinlerensis]NCU16958.1 glutamyl-tRNA reductase [Pallidibacillus pasinlerensis]